LSNPEVGGCCQNRHSSTLREGENGSPVTDEEGFHPRGKIVKTLGTGEELHSEEMRHQNETVLA
jgi:hypothetical protein